MEILPRTPFTPSKDVYKTELRAILTPTPASRRDDLATSPGAAGTGPSFGLGTRRLLDPNIRFGKGDHEAMVEVMSLTLVKHLPC